MVTTNQPDPCLTFVTGWNAALKECEAIAQVSKTDEAPNAYWATHVAGFFDRVNSGDVPSATTAEGAAAALRRTLEWDDIEDQDATMIRAALAFLDASAPTPPADPLLEVVTRYRSQLAEFNKVTGKTDDEANAMRDATWGPFEEGVTDGTIALPSPTTLAGAVAALRCAFDEDTTRAISAKLRDVAMAYLEGGTV